MTVGELIQELQYFNEDAEVRLAFQKNWPFEYSVGRVVEVPLEDGEYNEEGDVESIVYVGEGAQLGYLPGDAKEELGWEGM